MDDFGSEIELIDYLNVLWKRRWLIIIPTVLLALIVGVVSFLIPPKWEVDAIILPSKFFVQTEQGAFAEVVVMDPKQIAGQINEESYNRMIGAELNLDPRKFPKLKAQNLRDTKLVRVSLHSEETEKARAILNSLFQHLKGELDRKIDVEIKGIATQIAAKENAIKIKSLDIQSKEIEIDKFRQEIVAVGNKVKISEERSHNLVEGMKGVKARIDEIEKRQEIILAEKQGSVEALGLLLYSNEIQQNVRYFNTLDESLSAEKVIQEDLRLSRHEKEQGIKDLRNEVEKINQEIIGVRSDIELLNEKKQRIDYAQLVKEPTVSLYPVSPKKLMNVVLACLLGFFFFWILAFFLDHVEKRKSRLRAGS